MSILNQDQKYSATDRTPPPAILQLKIEGVPKELRAFVQFVVWALEWRDGKNGKPGKWTKPPLNPSTLKHGGSDNPATWAACAKAYAVYQANIGTLAGIGFVLTQNDHFCFLDLDNAVDLTTGKPKPWAQAILNRFPTYWEYSPTRTGIKVLLRGRLPADVVDGCVIQIGDGQIEMFQSGKFTTLTGHRGEEATATINACQAALDALYAELRPPKPVVALAAVPLTLDDEDLLRNCRGSSLFRFLESGDDREYGNDASRADLAYINVVVRNGGTREQADRLYRRSDRARPKWDERRGAKPYGEKTLDKAYNGMVQPFTPRPKLTVVQPLRAVAETATGVDIVNASDCDARLLRRVAALEQALAERDEVIVTLIAERDDARAAVSALVHTELNNDLTKNDKVGYVAAIALGEQKRQRGDVAEDGCTVILTSAEIADDWREEPERGEHVAPVNPTGTRPRMARKQVGPIMLNAASRGILDIDTRKVMRRRTNGSTYRDTEYVLKLPEAPYVAYTAAAQWHPDEPKARKPRAQDLACIHCGEVHAIHRRDYCGGCGALRNETIIEPTIDVDEAADPYVGKIIRHRDANPPIVVSNVLTVGKIIRHGDSVPPEPAWIDQAPPPDDQPGDLTDWSDVRIDPNKRYRPKPVYQPPAQAPLFSTGSPPTKNYDHLTDVAYGGSD